MKKPSLFLALVAAAAGLVAIGCASSAREAKNPSSMNPPTSSTTSPSTPSTGMPISSSSAAPAMK